MITPSDALFAGSIPELYDTHLVPLIFEPYALDLARRLAAIGPKRVLELAAGTGVVTRALANALPAATTIVATDLNQAMLDHAVRAGTSRAVEWRAADAMQLPFDAESFDAVVCQFGVMFFPDKPRAFAESRRVLVPGGVLIFNVWDGLEHNEFPDTVTRALAGVFAHDAPRFLERTPYAYHDRETITADLRSGGFTSEPSFEVIGARSRGASARAAAIAFCEGTPLRNEIIARGAPGLAAATEFAARVLAERFGNGAVEGRIQALVASVAR